MINPVNHGKDAALLEKYKVEPYVVAADVYGEHLNKSRGGWTWYTGSAGWMYQLITEWFIGLRKKGNTLQFIPCIPEEWDSVKISYRHETSLYEIGYVQKPGSAETLMKIVLDGIAVEGDSIKLVDDGATHTVTVQLTA